MRVLPLVLFALLLQTPQAPAVPGPFYWHDDYTEYHLLAPDTHQFAIVYYLNQRQAGLAHVLNQTRSGSEGSGIAVSDPRSGKPLKFDYMTGKELTAAGVTGRLNAEEHYIRAHLVRPVPQGGEGRVRIEKTYKDEKSYFSADGTITFARSLGIGRNLIVLPPGYQLVSSNVAADIMTQMDGRIAVSFENINGYASDVTIRARPGQTRKYAIAGGPLMSADFTKVLFELNADGTIRFRLHLVKAADAKGVVLLPSFCNVADAAAVDMDLGVPLKVAPPASARQLPTVTLTERPGDNGNAHIVVTGTLRDPNYKVGPEGVSWERAFTEPRATVVMPAGFEITGVRSPVTIGTLPDGRMYAQIVNNRIASSVRFEVWAGKK